MPEWGESDISDRATQSWKALMHRDMMETVMPSSTHVLIGAD